MFANFNWKDFMLLECYILRLLVLKNFIMLEDVGSMIFYYNLEGFMTLRDFHFMKLVEFFL